jgi:hypothetical protein
MIQAGNEMVEAEKLRNPQKAKHMEAMLQGHINSFLGLSADSGPRRKGFRGEREKDSGVKTNGIPG